MQAFGCLSRSPRTRPDRRQGDRTARCLPDPAARLPRSQLAAYSVLMAPPAVDDHDDQQADVVFKALSDRSRRLLLDTLRERNGQTLTELCAGLLMARQSVSKHLAVLEAALLVTTVRRGREKLHYLNPAPINEIAERWIRQYDQERVRALSDLKRALENKV
jgi:DNA-binding transcriptional ArsR family regulator